MNANVLTRALGFVLVFAALELAASLVWWAVHARDRRTLAELAPRIERLSAEVRDERRWLAGRRALGERLDDAAERLAAGATAFPSRTALDSARRAHERAIRAWNEALAEHERHNVRLDSVGRAYDGLVAAWSEAYRRAYPGWLILPRPEPPRPPVADG